MSASAAKNLPSPADLPLSNPPSETSQSLSQNLESIAASLRELSLSWKATNAGVDSQTWRRKWKGARNSLDELHVLSGR
jgi:hypothetical protein